jgi:hypothetical protein
MPTLARVLANGTNLDSIPGTISPAVRHTIKLCLEKDPRRRIADIRDVRLALEGTFETASPGAPTTVARSAWRQALALAAAALIAGVAAWGLKPAPLEAPGIETHIDDRLPEGITVALPLVPVGDVVSVFTLGQLVDAEPNAAFYVFVGSDGIYIRNMDDPIARKIPRTEGAVVALTVAPNGQDLAFVRLKGDATSSSPALREDAGVELEFELVRIRIGGGAPQPIADLPAAPRGLRWEGGRLLFGQPNGIWGVSENGGEPQRLVDTEDEGPASNPHLLPGGEWVLSAIRTPGDWKIVAESLVTQESRPLRDSAGFGLR